MLCILASWFGVIAWMLSIKASLSGSWNGKMQREAIGIVLQTHSHCLDHWHNQTPVCIRCGQPVYTAINH